MRIAFAVAILICHLVPLPTSARDTEDYQQIVAGAKLSDGPVQIFAKDAHHYLSLPPDIFDRTLIWSAEVARYPADAISLAGTEIATRAIKLERQGNRVLVRSLSSGSIRASGTAGFPTESLKMTPINIAFANAQIGPVLLSFDILAENSDGRILLETTGPFTSDIADYSVKGQLSSTGMTSIAVDPARSYIARASAHPTNIFLVSHLTFMAQDQLGQDRALSIEVAHTITMLPKDPMERRPFDPRVGYFATEVLNFEGDDGSPASILQLALRHRLTHADPDAPRPSDPVEPLVYYLSPEIPKRWRSYIRAAIEDWQPAFEAAGFSNAIVARDAPTQEEDPDWSINDASNNVIRWLTQPIANALGPNVHDPRTGEIISAHILVWPDVLNTFSDYYYLLMSDIDPRAQSLPLPEEVQGRILRYAVSHEVGHTLGLRHNHHASTAWSTDQLRDAAFVAEQGSTSSIMAYGRFNYVARPEDGIDQFFPLIGSYDSHAIEWGYTPNLDAAELDTIASASTEKHELVWGAGELPSEGYGRLDPKILTENIGANRIEATRAGVAALQSSLARLPDAIAPSPAKADIMGRVFDQAKERYLGFMDSVVQMVGGLTSTASDGLPTGYSRVEDSKAALNYLISEGVSGLDMFADPKLLAEFRPVGGLEGADAMARKLLSDILEPSKIRLVYTQNELRPDRNFGVAEMLAIITDAFLQDAEAIENMASPKRAALAQYVELLRTLPSYEGDPSVEVLAVLGFPQGLVDLSAAGLTDTGLDAAAARELERLVAALAPQGDGLATRLFKDVERLIGIDPDAEKTTATPPSGGNGP
ncbi:zinc-dependent metalloprotease [Sulfitobacter sp. TSTF-M16]|uniref:Zinc-dependent metalloprotease n=1 Tax=Sulfitobacter aestuariivivens TaxID=2766981 RepID=A0A927D062_9RHOB|nr:zinc-dependent metalloprotease [Sulfitobacter aestuariivivens]MBD3662610.1 zinc-dependent metalloprotease [Sulfitobacter aestuariivivens]